ncbi:MAG: hypothetical protein DRI39_08305 [Chloroflexi bacterium]|nr:MAG: hypothetical protein DRI39_08305 [Chloroflexota bacterium]RLC95147.1 MAG: hypothetical protein DRI40_06495 [Chloroflexota bacterium]
MTVLAGSARLHPSHGDRGGLTVPVFKLSGFVLVAVGTLGLLVTELAVDWGDDGSRPFTLGFAAANALGLAALAFSHGVARQ